MGLLISFTRVQRLPSKLVPEDLQIFIFVALSITLLVSELRRIEFGGDYHATKACCIHSASYPAALKKFRHSLMEKRSQIPSARSYDETMQKVDEDAAGHLGEVAELEPGASGSLTLTMKPGTYILYCNIPGHYAAGMWTLFTVK